MNEEQEGLYGGWSPGIGDPTPMGWLTVVAYFVAALACYRAYQRSRRAARAPGEGRVAIVWGGLALLLAILGVNKQLDLQSLLTAIGRTMAYEQGWYEERRAVQRIFVLGVAAGALAAAAGLVALARGHVVRLAPALFGAVFLFAFVLVRASSFHHMDAFIALDFCGIRMNWLLELSGIAFIGFAARRDRPPRARSAPPARSPARR